MGRRGVKNGSNLSYCQPNVYGCVWKMLYIYLMVITNQKPLLNMQRIKRKKSKYITKENQQTMKDRKTGIRESLQK